MLFELHQHGPSPASGCQPAERLPAERLASCAGHEADGDFDLGDGKWSRRRRVQGLGPVAGHASVPTPAQILDRRPAFLLEAKAADAFVAEKQVPLVQIAVLEEAASLKIMLAHRPVQAPHGRRGHGERLVQLAKGQGESLLVAVNVLIEKIGVLVEPERQAQRPPAGLLVHQHLSALDLPHRPRRQPEEIPDAVRAV